jgi:hypothetical protein
VHCPMLPQPHALCPELYRNFERGRRGKQNPAIYLIRHNRRDGDSYVSRHCCLARWYPSSYIRHGRPTTAQNSTSATREHGQSVHNDIYLDTARTFSSQRHEYVVHIISFLCDLVLDDIKRLKVVRCQDRREAKNTAVQPQLAMERTPDRRDHRNPVLLPRELENAVGVPLCCRASNIARACDGDTPRSSKP